MKLKAVPTPIDVAIERARKHIALWGDIQQRTHSAESELNKVTETDSAAALDAVERGIELPATDRTTQLTAEIGVLRRALVKAYSQAHEAIAEIYRSAASVERVLAEEKREQREQILTKVRKPLVELALLIGVPEIPLYTLRCVPQGVWITGIGLAYADFRRDGPGNCAPTLSEANPQPYMIPAFDVLAIEAEAHEARAASLDQAHVDESGELAGILERVIAAVMPATAAIEATEAA